MNEFEGRLSVAFVLPDLRGGGAERVFLNLLRRLDRTRFRPSLVLGSEGGELGGAVPSDVPVRVLGARRARGALLPAYRALREIRPEIVFSTLGLGNAVLALKGVLPAGTRYVMRLGNTLSGEAEHAWHPWRAVITRAVLRHLYGKADRVICQSRPMLEDAVRYLSLPRDRFLAIHNPLDVDRIDSGASGGQSRLAPGNPRLLAVGRLHSQKGFDVLLSALPEVLEDFPDATLTILGEGVERERLESDRSALGLDEVVHMPGYVDNPYPSMKEADLFVLPSHFEGFPNVLLESLAVGTPAVVTDCPGGHREVIAEGRNGWFAQRGNSADLADTIKRALRERGGLRMEEESREVRRRFDLDRICGEYEEALWGISREQSHGPTTAE